MRRFRNNACLVGLLVAAASTGCETFTPPTQRLAVEKDKALMVDTVATRRGTYLFKRENTTDDPSRWVLVAEPPPDAALASAVKAAVEASAKTAAAAEVSGKGSLDVTQTLTKLVERTQAITILRDSLFRLSEAYANGTIDKATYSTKYDKVLDLVSRIVEVEATAVKNETETLKRQQQILSDPTLQGDDKVRALQSVQ